MESDYVEGDFGGVPGGYFLTAGVERFATSCAVTAGGTSSAGGEVVKNELPESPLDSPGTPPKRSQEAQEAIPYLEKCVEDDGSYAASNAEIALNRIVI